MKRLLSALLTLFLARDICAQQAQSQTAPLSALNAQWVQGVGIGYAPTAGSGLTLDLAGGTANCGGTIVTYGSGTLTMTASTTNYVYLNTASSCVPAVKTTAFTASDIPVAVVVTGSSTITSIADDRTMFFISGGGTVNGIIVTTSSSPTCGQFVHVNNGSTSVTMTLPAVAAGCQIVIEQDESSTAAISIPGVSSPGITSLNSPGQRIFIWTDGTNFYSTTPLLAGTNCSLTPSSSGLSVSCTGGGGGGSSFPWTIVQSQIYSPAECSSTCTLSFPHTMASSGNTGLLIVSSDGSQTITFPPGWSCTGINVTEATYARLTVCTMASSSQTSAAFSASGGFAMCAWFMEISGSHALDQSSTGGQANSASVTLPSITPTAGSVVFGMVAALQASGTNYYVMSNSLDPTWRDVAIQTGTVNGGGGRILFGWIGTGAASHVSTTPPEVLLNSITTLYSSGGMAYATFSIL